MYCNSESAALRFVPPLVVNQETQKETNILKMIVSESRRAIRISTRYVLALRYRWWLLMMLAAVMVNIAGCGQPMDKAISQASVVATFTVPATQSPLRITIATSTIARPSLRQILPPTGYVPTTPPVCSADGGSSVAIDQVQYPGLAGLAWAAEQIVRGTVLEQLARWEPIGIGDSSIITYSLVQVEQRIRGQPVDYVIVAHYGGTLDGCTQASSLPTLYVNEQALLFLLKRSLQPSLDSKLAIYNAIGGSPGIQEITRQVDGMLWVTIVDKPRLVTEAIEEIRTALGQPPPKMPQRDIVPLDRAPLAPVATPNATPVRP